MESSRRRPRSNGVGVMRKRLRFKRKAVDDARNRLGKRRSQNIEALDSTVMVKDLDKATTSESLREFFENFGDVSQARMVGEQGYGLVTFDAKEIAEGVIAASKDKEGIHIGNSNRKVRISWAASSFPSGVETSNRRPEIRTAPMKRRRHHQEVPQQCKSRLFISAVASAVASTNSSECVPQVPQILPPRRPVENVAPLPNRQVIAYDDWL